MTQTNGVRLERGSRRHATVLAGHDTAATALGVARCGYAVDVQLAGKGSTAATIFGNQVVQARDHFRTAAGIRGACSCDHKAMAGPMLQQPGIGAWRTAGAVTPENDRVAQ